MLTDVSVSLFMLQLSIILIVAVINLFLALFVLLNNSRSRTNQLFFATTICFILFALVNYVSLNPVGFDQLVWIRLDLLIAVYLFLCTYLMFAVFPHNDFESVPIHQKIFIWYSVLVSFLILTPLVFSSLSYINGQPQLTARPGIVFFTIQQLTALILGTRVVIKKLKTANKKAKKQLKIVSVGAALALILIIAFNLIAVQVFHVTALISVSSLGTFIFTLSFAYAIIRHRFLNIRLLVARTIAYVLLLSTMVVLYAIVIFGLKQFVFGESSFTSVEQIVNIVLAVFVAFTFQPLKQFFDKLTNRLFYQDAYSSEELLKSLNDILVSTLEIRTLLADTSKLLQEQFKTAFCLIIANQTKNVPQIIEVSQTHNPGKDLSLIANFFPKLKDKLKDEKILFGTFLSSGEKRVRSWFLANQVEVIVELAQDMHSDQEAIGYLMLGPKKSGSAFTSKDRNLLLIIANELVIAVQNSLRFEEIKSFSHTLQQRVTAATAELKDKNTKLEELDKAKDDFISMASHQLRTPLTTVKGYLSMMLEGDFGKLDRKQKEVLDLTYGSAERMIYLIADLLNVSRINTGKFVIDAKEVNLADTISLEIKQLERTAKVKGLTLKAKLPKNFPTILLDEMKTQQVIMNFVDNAIYYTHQGGEVKIELKQTKDAIEFTVTDNGIGIPKNAQDQLFTKFFRADNARKARPDGTGLGLYMAKKVISSQGGSIIFESKENKGSTFGFRFSLAAVAARKSTTLIDK